MGDSPGKKKGSLVGLLSLSDVLRYLVGGNLKGHEVPGLGALSLSFVAVPEADASAQAYMDSPYEASTRRD